jgi:hypothetical protein
MENLKTVISITTTNNLKTEEQTPEMCIKPSRATNEISVHKCQPPPLCITLIFKNICEEMNFGILFC